LKGSRWTAKNDTRIIRFGEFLRKTHIDELPQVINILKRDMTLIGPRPERLDLYPYVVQHIPYYQERLYLVLPGLTGLAQVTYGYDNTIVKVRRRVALDHAYATYLTKPWIWFKTDMSIIFKTIQMILFGKNP
jgi:lipopolysaccharide/colanic/teichoic acid biosynthesis glycosyltransferase